MPRPGYPIVYQDHMRVVIAGDPGKGQRPQVGINRIGDTDVPLILTVDEARELAQALTWALMELDAHNGRETFWQPRPDAQRYARLRKPAAGDAGHE